jgi:hypothetical protein
VLVRLVQRLSISLTAPCVSRFKYAHPDNLVRSRDACH